MLLSEGELKKCKASFYKQVTGYGSISPSVFVVNFQLDFQSPWYLCLDTYMYDTK